MTQFKSLAYLWSIATEGEAVNSRNVEKIITADPVMAGMGGACVFIYTAAMAGKVRKFLDSDESSDDGALRTNNPDLIKDLKLISEFPSDNTYLACFSTKLKEMLTPEEFEAVVQHEYGHVFHRHLEKTQWFETHETFLKREEEADNHATKSADPLVMISALEKCMKFGAEQAVLWGQGASGNWLRKLLDTDIIDAMTIKQTLVQARLLHGRRFKTLQALKKQMEAGKAPASAPSSAAGYDRGVKAREQRLRVAKQSREHPEAIKRFEEDLAKYRAEHN